MLTTVFSLFACLFVCLFVCLFFFLGGGVQKLARNKVLMKRMSDEKSKITIVYNLITSPSIPSEDNQKTDQVLVLFYSNIFEILYSGKKADFLSDKIFTLHLTIHELRVLFSNK